MKLEQFIEKMNSRGDFRVFSKSSKNKEYLVVDYTAKEDRVGIRTWDKWAWKQLENYLGCTVLDFYVGKDGCIDITVKSKRYRERGE